MKIKALALSLFVAGLGASYALADNGHGRGDAGARSTTVTTTAAGSATTSADSTTTSPERSRGKGRGRDNGNVCRPVEFELHGTFVAAGSDGSSFSMTVAHANRFARSFGASPTVTTDARTRIRRAGKQASLTDLQAGDRLSVQGRACRTAAAGTAPSLLAVRVVARPAKSATPTTTTTDTTTTDATTTTDTTTTTS